MFEGLKLTEALFEELNEVKQKFDTMTDELERVQIDRE